MQIAGRAGPELILVTGAFLVGYLKRFGVLGAGLGSQIYIGELLAYGARLTAADLRAIGIAALIAALASIVPRVLSGPAERPISIPALAAGPAPCSGRCSPEFFMGLQAAIGALVIVVLNDLIGLVESSWAITACTYVVAGSATGTIQRVRRRIIGTLIGVPLGLACLLVAVHAPLLIWAAAAFAMVVYAMALPERYDIACAAFAFTLIVTLAASGVHSPPCLQHAPGRRFSAGQSASWLPCLFSRSDPLAPANSMRKGLAVVTVRLLEYDGESRSISLIMRQRNA